MAYFTWSTGFRPGGDNRLPTASAYSADTLTNFELGWKTDWFEHRLRANGAVFYEKWFDVQTAVQGQYGITSIVNAGNARVEGLESALEWAATEHLVFSGCGYGPLRMETTSVFCAPTQLGVEQKTCTAALVDAYPGTQLPGTPKVKTNGTGRYTFDVGSYKSYVQGVSQSPELDHVQSRGDALLCGRHPIVHDLRPVRWNRAGQLAPRGIRGQPLRQAGRARQEFGVQRLGLPLLLAAMPMSTRSGRSSSESSSDRSSEARHLESARRVRRKRCAHPPALTLQAHIHASVER